MNNDDKSWKGNVLVMDDEEGIREIAHDILQYLGYSVGLASDGNEAVDLYKKTKDTGGRFDAVIIDLTIKGGPGGLETITALKSIDPSVKGIVSSGLSSDPVISDYRKYGFVAVMPKPYKIQEMKELLDRVISSTHSG
jgi:Response regulator containing CheY-like receiver, AAA-type ATPase, and DNA-binding domains